MGQHRRAISTKSQPPAKKSQSPFPRNDLKALQTQGSGRAAPGLWDGSDIFSIFLIDFSIVLSALPSETDRLTEPGCPIARRIRSVDGNRLVAPLKHMPAPHVRAVPALAVSREQPLHAGDKIGLRCLKKQMEMVPHQHPRMDLPAMTFTNLPESVEKHLAVIVGDQHLRLPRCHVPSRDITHRHTEIEVGGPCGKLDPKHQQGKKNVNPCTLTPLNWPPNPPPNP